MEIGGDYNTLEESKQRENSSDSMICNSTAYNTFFWKKMNDLVFLNQMNKSQQTNLMDRCVEDKLRMTQSRECEVSDRIKTRGGNGTDCREPVHFAKGFQCYNTYHLSEFMLTPCPINTWKNSIISNEYMGCSKRHQFFANITKRK